MKENNRIRKKVAKLAATVLTAALAFQAVMPVTEVQAATSTENRMLEIPVSFQTDQKYVSSTRVSDYDVARTYTGNKTSLAFECSGAEFTPDSRLSYRVCIPVSYLENEDSMVVMNAGTAVWNVETGKNLWGYNVESAIVAVSADGIMVYAMIDGIRDFYTLEEAAEKYDSKLSVQMEETGDFYVISIDAKADIFDEHSVDYAESGAADLEDVMVCFFPSIHGFSMDVPDGNVYIDDITFTSASGETLHTEDFEDAEDVLDIGTVIYDGSGNKTTIKKLNVETIYDNELLTTLKSKVSVKKGKKKSLSSYVNAVSTDEVTYTSSNKKVATVNSKGVVKGKKKGTATITVTANGVKKKIKVTVK